MCILFIAIEQHPDYPVIICANRDEFHQRPTQRMHWWQKENILAGKDLKAGGSWLGLTQTGQFAALTNFRIANKFDANKQTRGDLVVNALLQSPQQTRDHLGLSSEQYNDFNLIFGTLNNLQAFDSVNKSLISLGPGFHSICNGALDDIWPKMALGVQKINQLIKGDNFNLEQLFSLMKNNEIASDINLPTTGISKELESLLSSIFIRSDDYGTRSTAIIMQSQSGAVKVYERNYSPQGNVEHSNEFSW